MKTVKKLGAVALFMALVMLIFGTFNGVETTRKARLRTMSIDGANTLTYAEKAGEKLADLDYYDFSISNEDDDILIFSAGKTMTPSELSECDFVNCDTEEEIFVSYNIECDKSTTELNASITYSQGDLIVNEENFHIVKVEYDADSENAFIFFEDGTVVNSIDYLDSGSLENCSIAIASAGLMTIVEAVVIVVLVAVVVYAVLSWFFPWLKKKITQWQYEQRTIYQQSTVAIPALEIDGVRFETKAKSKAEVQALPKKKNDTDPAIYYLAFASGIASVNGYTDTVLPEGGLYIGDKITFDQAVEIMESKVVEEIERGGVVYSFIPSIYSYYESDILSIMDVETVGYHESTPRLKPEQSCSESGVTGLFHYHPMSCYNLQVKRGKGTKTYRHHAFFMLNDISYWYMYQRG